MEGDPGDGAHWPTEGLDELERLSAEAGAVEAAICGLIAVLRDDGVPWRRVGEALGVSRQAVHQRYARKTPRLSTPPDRALSESSD